MSSDNAPNIALKQRWIRKALEICDVARRRTPLSRGYLRSEISDDDNARSTIEFVRMWLQDAGLTEDAWFLMGMEHAAFDVDDCGATIFVHDYRKAYTEGRDVLRKF